MSIGRKSALVIAEALSALHLQVFRYKRMDIKNLCVSGNTVRSPIMRIEYLMPGRQDRSNWSVAQKKV